ncbi:MAG: DUF192 domain-containing protein [Minwuia sp.]|uniref:DUF192 domain-containing protein n=1 Tax=Minwuia sp. TaxID=2493630 RepID=UPI003A84CCF8
MRKWLSILLIVLCLPAAAQEANYQTLLVETSTGERLFMVEVVDTPAERAQGLMNRASLPQDHGMLFDFDVERRVSFWMKDTLIPLDMLFADAEGRIRHIHPDAVPHDTTAIPSTVPVRYVLEINGGLSRELGIAPGDRLRVDRLE